MDKELISKIAIQIVNEEILHNWKFYLVIGGIYFLVYCFASILKPYLGKRGEALARKSDLKEVLAEVRKTTELTENIKKEIDNESWIAKEFNILRRQKLEELLIRLYEYKNYIKIESNHLLFNEEKSVKPNPLDHVTAIHKLYFPELDESMILYYKACADWGEWMSEAITQILNKSSNGQLHCTPDDGHIKKYSQVLTDINFAIKGIEDKSKLVMETLRAM